MVRLFWALTAVIMICKGGELGVAYITQLCAASFKCSHITVFTKKQKQTSEDFV